ncbi:MAG: hypothetical protein AAGD07_04285 [Planctomycetota bacterium]
MNFEDLQVIWNSMEDQPLYALDHKAMHAMVEARTRRIHRTLDKLEWTWIGVALSTAVILPLDAWREGGGAHQYLVALVCAAFGFSLAFARWQRSRCVVRFDDSLKGIVQSAVSKIDRYLMGLKWCYWGFHVPIALVGLIGLTVARGSWSPGIAAAVLGVSLVSYVGVRRDAQVKRQEKRELSQLLEKLNMEPETTLE